MDWPPPIVNALEPSIAAAARSTWVSPGSLPAAMRSVGGVLPLGPESWKVIPPGPWKTLADRYPARYGGGVPAGAAPAGTV